MRSGLRIVSFFFIMISIIGCSSTYTTTVRLPAYDYAINMEGPKRPKLFFADSIKIKTALTPYAVISAPSEPITKSRVIREIWRKAAEIKADIVVIKEGSSQYAGSVSTATAIPFGFGPVGAIGMSIPVYLTPIYGYCYRLNPSRVGIETDESKMILSIENEDIRNGGILEGDKIYTINNFQYNSVDPGALKIHPGEEITISVIRPGTGKLERKIKAMKNEPQYLDYSDAVEWKDLSAEKIQSEADVP